MHVQHTIVQLKNFSLQSQNSTVNPQIKCETHITHAGTSKNRLIESLYTFKHNKKDCLVLGYSSKVHAPK